MRSHRKTQLIRAKSVQSVQKSHEEGVFSGDFDRDLREMQAILANSSDLKLNIIRTAGMQRVGLLYYGNMIDTAILTMNIIRPLQATGEILSADRVTQQLISVPDTMNLSETRFAANTLSRGVVLLLLEGVPLGVIVNITKVARRPIERSKSEDNILGPHESFSENMAENVAMLRQTLATPSFKIHTMEIGRLSRTKVALLYVEGVVQPELVKEAITRLERIKIDFIHGAGYLRDFLEDQPNFLLPQVRVTERPTRVIAALLEGRVAIIADGDPTALLAPAFLPEFIQSSEDYHDKAVVAIFYRLIRTVSSTIAIFLPGIWIALVQFHHGIIPPPLLNSIVAGREQVPLPTVLEATLMLFAFDIVIESSSRLPSAVGQAIGIVGAIILGQSAVQASLISPTIVIVVALSGLAVYTQPSPTMLGPVRVMKYLVLAAAAIFGLYGVVWIVIFLIINAVSARSFGYPYMFPLAPFNVRGMLDIAIRRPNYQLKYRPHMLSPDNERRLAEEPGPVQGGGEPTDEK